MTATAHPACATVSPMSVRRVGGGLVLGEGRIGVPIDTMPAPGWTEALREAMTSDRLEDPRWQHAALAVTTDAIPHLVLPTVDTEPADFLAGYAAAIDVAIAAANEATREWGLSPTQPGSSQRDQSEGRGRLPLMITTATCEG
jgi:hypothetical protein